MEKDLKIKLLESIGSIFEQSKECKLESSYFEKIDNELKLLSDYFNVSKNQSFFIAMIFALNYMGKTVDINALIQYFDCNPMKLLEYSEDFELLYSKGIFSKQKSSLKAWLTSTGEQFSINEKIKGAILQNKPLPLIEKEEFKDVVEFLEKIYNTGQQRDNDEISTVELFIQIEEMVSSNLHFPLVKKIYDLQFRVPDTYIYFYLIWKALLGNETNDIRRALEGVFDKTSERVKYLQKILSGENALIKNNLAEIVEASFFNDIEIKLSEYSLNIISEYDLKLIAKNQKKDNIIQPSQIKVRKLVFNEDEMNQLVLLKNLLQDSNLYETQNKLLTRNFSKGITVLLHGQPGTGKTETVLQLAKETNHVIMKVEISQLKSMWFGESEKNIKRIFTDYKSYAKECERIPILFFNEADALISKRREISNSNTAQTENAIQNIILEELENFEGILIATTNLANNFDTAFERRFLFKIKFQLPDISTKAKIWKLKLPNLSTSDCEDLASRFNFSGGQIDNIARKNEIHEILYGLSDGYKSILKFCQEEILGNNRLQIGFTKS